MSKKVDFLQPKTDEIRHQIRGILDSYTHDWDLLSELAQNSVDAIREANPEKGHIELSIDGAAKRITISDNGVGVNPADIERLLRPFGTDKVRQAEPGWRERRWAEVRYLVPQNLRLKAKSMVALHNPSPASGHAS